MLRNRVREVRETLGRTQEGLAEESGVSLRLLRLIETRPGYEPTGRVMVRLSNALHVDLGHLFWIEKAREPEAVAV